MKKIIPFIASPVAPGASFTAYGLSNNPSNIRVISGSLASIDGQNNGVIITADQDIVAMANEHSYPGGGKNQGNKNYEGFNHLTIPLCWQPRQNI